jgi:hypothetical protein
MCGTYQHCAEKHLDHNLAEFYFRYYRPSRYRLKAAAER